MILLILILILVVAGTILVKGYRNTKNKKRFRVIACIIFATLTLPVSLPWALIGFNTLRCGHAPVIGSSFAAGYSYRLPSSHSYTGDVNIFTNAFFCSQQEAENAGYHKSTLELTP